MTLARDGPNNTIYVTAATAGNSGHTYACTAAGVPYTCCTGNGTGTCDTTLNGADICIGLEECETAGGCRLQLPDDTIHEAEFRIYGTPWWTPGGADKPCGGNYADGFPNGLVIQGKGIGNTILEATAEGDTNDNARTDVTGFANQSVICASNGGGLTRAEMPRLVFQDFTIDGQRELQDSTITTQSAWCGYSNTAEEQQFNSLTIRRVRMENTTFHGLYLGNFEAQASGTNLMGPVQILQSEFYGGGCHQAHSDGGGNPGMLPCGCDRSDAGVNCAGWDDEPELCPPGACPGWVNQGSNITLYTPSNALIAYNTFDLGLHYVIGVGTAPGSCLNGFEGAEPTTPDLFAPHYCGNGVTIANNHFRRIGGAAIDGGGVWKAIIKDNIFDGDCLDDEWSDSQCGDMNFSYNFTAELQILRNTFSNESPTGVNLSFWRPSVAERGIHTIFPPNLVEGNTFELDCGRCDGTQQYCEPFTIRAGNAHTDFQTGTYDNNLDSIEMRNNTFQDTDATNDCTGSLSVSPFEMTGNFGRVVGLTIDGDAYEEGGQDTVNDGWGSPGTPTLNRAGAYFNYVSNLRIENVTGAGKVTFGRNAGNDNMQDGCYDTLGGVTVNDRAGLTTPCVGSLTCEVPWEVPCVL